MANPHLERIALELETISMRLAVPNRMPSRRSKWYQFAKKFGIGIIDLDNIAHDLRLRKFKLMEKEGSPHEIFVKVHEHAFFKALRDTSMKAYGMDNNPLRRMIQKFK